MWIQDSLLADVEDELILDTIRQEGCPLSENELHKLSGLNRDATRDAVHRLHQNALVARVKSQRGKQVSVKYQLERRSLRHTPTLDKTSFYLRPTSLPDLVG